MNANIKDIPEWVVPALKKEIRNHFKERAIFGFLTLIIGINTKFYKK